MRARGGLTGGHLCIDLTNIEMSGEDQQDLLRAVQTTVVAHLARQSAIVQGGHHQHVSEQRDEAHARSLIGSPDPDRSPRPDPSPKPDPYPNPSPPPRS